MENYRFYPEGNIGSHIIGFVGHNGDEQVGQYGLEGFFNEELKGKHGSVRAERSVTGDLIIINDREYRKPVDGSDLVLTINRSLQFHICRKLAEASQQYAADKGSVIVMDPNTGAIMAMCSWPDYDPNNYRDVADIKVYNNPAIFDQYEPGSTFKVITMAASLDQGKVLPSTTYEDKGFLMIEGWPKPIKNSDYETRGGYGRSNMINVLEYSLNTGAIFAMQRIGPATFGEYLEKFGFGEKTGIEMQAEGVTTIKNLKAKNIRPIEAATASFGQGITVTPLQLVTAFGAIANGGILMKPYLVKEIVYSDGTRHLTQPKEIRRVVSERAAMLLSGMMVNVIENGHAKLAGVQGYYVAGKTGTAQVPEAGGYGDKTIHNFVGFSPVEEPKFVMLVRFDNAKNVKYAASSAAPLFGELAEFILNYYKVPKER
jgi:cell division protein FtsI/penicillin-binding protein 2